VQLNGRGLTLGAADEQIGQRERAGDNSYRSSVAKVLAGLAADPYGVRTLHNEHRVNNENDKTIGIFLIKGSKVTIPAFELTISPDGEIQGGPSTLLLAIDIVGPWLGIGLDHLASGEVARSALLQAMQAQDDPGIAEALITEATHGMQVAVAAGVAIDALYTSVRDRIQLPPNLIATWRAKRTSRASQIIEVFRRGVSFKPREVARLTPLITEVMRFRGMAVHPPTDARHPALHPILDRGVEWRLATFRVENQRSLMRAALAAISQLTARPKPATEQLRAYFMDMTVRVQPFVARWSAEYGPLLG
jgi:hypothetical protein